MRAFAGGGFGPPIPAGPNRSAPALGSKSVKQTAAERRRHRAGRTLQPSAEEAAAGCRPLRGRNRSACPSAKQQQSSECGTQLAKRTHDADASCGPSPPKAAARRSLRDRVRRDRPTRRPAKPGPPIPAGSRPARQTDTTHGKIRPADPCGTESGAADRHDARQSPARRSLPKSGRPSSYLIRSLSLRSW